MKNKTLKLLLLLALNILVVNTISAQIGQVAGKTIVTEILVNYNSLDPEGFKTYNINQNDNIKIKFDYQIDDPTAAVNSVRALLNGAPINNVNLNGKFIELTNLIPGRYILKLQGTLLTGGELFPVILEFSIKEGTVKQAEQDDVKNGFNITYLLYGTIALQFIIIIVLLLRKSNKTGVTTNNSTEVVTNELGNKVKQVSGDLQHAYEQLKKKLKILENENSFQRSQIRELKERISDLEQANLKLAEKKDKLVESKQQLEEIQHHKEELFAIAIHDIKNPASAIKSYIELIQSYDLNAVEQSEIMESMIRSSEQIVELAHEMTSVIAQSQPEPLVNLEMSSLKKIIDSVCTQNKGYALKKEINLVNKSSLDLPNTKLDPAKMEEVLDNLINNAIKYAPKNTFVNVSTFFTSDKITVEIVDNGVGLSEEDIKRAFTRGGKLSSVPTAGEKSSGLGLWIVKKIIEEHGGRVWVKSKLGHGSTFGFELPIVKE